MRNLAARLGVRASSLYRHFPDRSSIEQSLALRAAEKLLDCMQQATEGLTGERALFAASRAYLEYAGAESSFYQILMQKTLAGAQPNPAGQVTNRLWEYFVRLAGETINLGDDLSPAAALWSFLHGFTVLSSSGMFGEADPKLVFPRSTQALIRGLSVANADAVRSPS